MRVPSRHDVSRPGRHPRSGPAEVLAGGGGLAPLLLVAGAFLTAPAARAWEVRLCDNADTADCSTGCRKQWSDPRTIPLQIDLADLDAVVWDNCGGVPIGGTLRRIAFRVPTWYAELYAEDGLSGTGSLKGLTPFIDVGPGEAASLTLVGPAVRFCDDTACSRWTDIVDPPRSRDADVAGSRVPLPGRVARSSLAAGGPGCPARCIWRYQDYADIQALNLPMNDAITVVRIRNAAYRLNYCRSTGFADCVTTYQGGPWSSSLAGGAWDDAISSFDLLRRAPNATSAHWQPATCSSLGTFGAAQPGGPTTCDAHSDCLPPYSCTCDNPPGCASSQCRLAACFEHSFTGTSGAVRVYYHQRMARNLLGTDLTAEYRESWRTSVAARIAEMLEQIRSFMGGTGAYGDGIPPDAPLGHPYANQPALADVLAWSHGEGGSCAGDWINFGAWTLMMQSDRPWPDFYRAGQGSLFHEYIHMLHHVHHRAGGMDFGNPGWGITEGLAEVLPSFVDWNDGIEEFVYDKYLVGWPDQEYCCSEAGSCSAGCYGLQYADLPVYDAHALDYNALFAWSYLGAQFMSPNGLVAMDPRDHVFPDEEGQPLFQPLRYHRFWRQVADSLYATPHLDPNTERGAWAQRLAAEAAAGAGGTPWKKCVHDDPSLCPLGAGPTYFSASSSIDAAFRRWARTHVERYTPAERSRMHLKHEMGGIQGVYASGGNEQPTFVAVPFNLGATRTPFTVIVTARTTFYSTHPALRDSLRVYIDTDAAGNRPAGKRYDDEYSDAQECWAFGHDYPGSAGCLSTIAGNRETDAPQIGPRATMRFIPSTQFANFAAGGSGPHTLYVAAFNDPVLYSVEVVPGEVAPFDRAWPLRGLYCNAFPNAQCKFDDPLHSVTMASVPAARDLVVQLVARVSRQEEPIPFAEPDSYRTAHEGIRVRTTEPSDYWVVGSETRWGAFHGYPMLGNRFVLRMEKDLPAGAAFIVDSHDAPYYDHVISWERPAALIAGRYYPMFRGPSMYGYAIDPVADEFGVMVKRTGGNAAINLVIFCENAAGAWSKLSERAATSGLWYTYRGFPCRRAYVLAGSLAPATDAGQVYEVAVRGAAP